MSRYTKKGAIADAEARKYLSSEKRRAEPRVRQTRPGEAEVLVPRSTGSRPPIGAVGPLRQINHNREAERPGSTTKAWDDSSLTSMLENCTIQFGKHKGKTFKWLREEKVDYIAYVAAGHMQQKESSSHQDRLKANKDDLAKYAMSHPEIREKMELEIAYKKAKERSLQPGQQGAALVGFGPDPWETLKDLYESKDPEKIRFVNYIRSKKSTCKKGSTMETAFKYIQQQDEARARPANTTTISHFQRTLNFSQTGNQTPSTTKSGDRFLTKEEKHFVDKHRTQLIGRVTNIGPILDELLDKGVILPERYAEIRALPTSQEKMRTLIFECLKAGSASKDVFYTILEEKEKYLIEDLKENH